MTPEWVWYVAMAAWFVLGVIAGKTVHWSKDKR